MSQKWSCYLPGGEEMMANIPGWLRYSLSKNYRIVTSFDGGIRKEKWCF